MACEKYSGWMIGAALGALRAADEAELRAHASGCRDCRGEWDAMRALVAAVDRGVQAMVAGEPSPNFAARLRARIAEERAPAAWPWLTWPRITAAALAAAVLLAVLLVRAPQRGRQLAPITANTPAQSILPVPSESLAPREHFAVKTPAVSHRGARANSETASLSMEVLVPKGQISAALILCDAVNAGAIDGAQLSALVEQSAEPIEVQALVIAPLESPAARPTTRSSVQDGARD